MNTSLLAHPACSRGVRFASLSLLLFLVACATRQPAPPRPASMLHNYDYVIKHLEWMITDEMARNKITGLSIALVAQGDTLWQRGFGLANKANRERATPQTRFRAGSIAKPLNAIAVMRLAEQQKLDLEVPVGNYIAGFHPASPNSDGEAITLKLLLSHQGGMPSDLIKGMWTENPATFGATLDYLNTNFLVNAPANRFRYSNLGHNVIGAVIENQSRTDYQQYMQALLRQLGMNASSFSPTPHQPKTAEAYDRGRPQMELPLRDVPAAGLTTNASDLAQLIKLFTSQGHIGDQTVLSRMSISRLLDDYTSHNPLNFGRRHGLGLYYFDGLFHRSVDVLGHGGASVNHRALIKFAPRQKIGVALLSNSKNSGSALHKIGNQALVLLLEVESGKPAPKQQAFWPQKAPEEAVTKDALVGHYATPAGMAKISHQGSQLRAQIAGKTLRLYQRVPGGLYYAQYRLFGLFPLKLGYPDTLGLAVRRVDNEEWLVGTDTRGRTTLLGQKISPAPIPAAWRERIGRYRLANPLSVIKLVSGGIRIKDDFLLAYARTDQGDRMEVVLQPLNDHRAIAMGPGRGFGGTISATMVGGREMLRYSGLLFEKR